MNHYNRFSPSYNLYSFHQPPPYSQHGSYTPPAPPGAGTSTLSMAAGGTEHADFAIVDSIGVKVINPDKKNEAKLFMLRDVNFYNLNTPKDLHAVIIGQLGRKAVAEGTDFEVGYYVGNKRVWIRNQKDIHDVIHLLKTKDNHSVTLWCMGQSATPAVPSTGSKRPRNATVLVSDSDSDEEPPEKRQTSRSKQQKKKKSRQEEKLERVDDLIDELKEKHGTKYNAVQYRMWAETIDSGRHSSSEIPPRGSIFKSQGEKDADSGGSLTPSKVASLRSTYIQQIKDLHSLKEAGAISDDHFVKQRDVLLSNMDKLQ